MYTLYMYIRASICSCILSHLVLCTEYVVLCVTLLILCINVPVLASGASHFVTLALLFLQTFCINQPCTKGIVSLRILQCWMTLVDISQQQNHDLSERSKNLALCHSGYKLEWVPWKTLRCASCVSLQSRTNKYHHAELSLLPVSACPDQNLFVVYTGALRRKAEGLKVLASKIECMGLIPACAVQYAIYTP